MYTASLMPRRRGRASAQHSPTDVQEYQRCAHTLKRVECTDSKSKFLEIYALYLAGERRKRCGACLAGVLLAGPTCTAR